MTFAKGDIMSRIFAIASTLCVIGFLGWNYWLGQAGGQFAECRGGTVAGGAIGGPLTLIDEAGAVVTDADLFKKPALVYFGYSFCPDVCPLDNVRNAEAVDILEERGFEVTPYFISVDPERDTPQAMAEYTGNIHERLVGLTGSPEQIKAAAAAYKVVYRSHLGEGEFYSVDHTTFTYLMLPGGVFADFFKRDDTADALAEKTACYLKPVG